MNPKHTALWWLVACLTANTAMASEPAAPIITNINGSGAMRNLRFAPYPAAQAYTVLGATNLAQPLAADTNFTLSPYVISASAGGTNYGYEWRRTNVTAPAGFYRVAVTPLASNALLTANVLNRLAYGPTPDELERVAAIGPQAFIVEQLAPWALTENAELADTNIATLGAKMALPDEVITTNHLRLPEFRAWHVLRAVNANRQLLEILLQFWENHFVTEYGKSYSWLNNNYSADSRRRLAAQMEYAENQRWRAALTNSQCTFYDLLKISAESPAMIIYLDTVASDGRTGKVANENYARELLELFCFGVDNGYDQSDITVMSRAWTGWRVEIVHPTNAFNPFAPQSPVTLDGTGNNIRTNLYGVYAFNYQSTFHNISNKTVFPAKTVPARFGAPWAGANYQLTLTNGSGTNSIQDGYQVIQHMANQPFTEEYISVKLCRLFVHDGFPNPSTDSNTVEYAFYNYTAGNLTPEAQLVHDCMLAWETNSPKGQIWKVLKVITDSDLFRTHAAAQQKVKTPLEFLISAVRALRSSTNGTGVNGTFTADTDGLAISGTSLTSEDADSPLLRMGNMRLFDRDAPDGYPEDGPAWISAGTLAERIRWIQSYCIASGQTGHTGSSTNDAGNSVCNPVQLLQAKLPSSSWTNATAVANYFVNTLYPGEGAANLQLYRDAAVNFLNTNDTNAPAAFSGLTPSSAAGNTYDTRVRGMVGFLMSQQRFHEQ
ncbi:MAG: DUF1800 family protein [Verrucomicrobia bacterium]|nr:DUF1800 family protein [Verrucomicrobiota bacterium]